MCLGMTGTGKELVGFLSLKNFNVQDLEVEGKIDTHKMIISAHERNTHLQRCIKLFLIYLNLAAVKAVISVEFIQI